MKLENVTVRYGDKTVLNRLSLTISDSGLMLIDAPSGCGKTTLFRAIAGLIPLSGGKIETPGTISYAFQEARLLNWYTAWENVALVRADRSPELAKEWLLRLGFTPQEMDLYPPQLSGGMRQRVNLARAFFYEGELFLLDEPFAGLDEQNVSRVLESILSIRTSRPVLLVDHGSLAAPYADRVWRLEDLCRTENESRNTGQKQQKKSDYNC